MPVIVISPQGGTVIDTPAGISLFHMKAQLSACRLELRGMRHSSGRSITKFVKDSRHLKGNKESVVNQFAEIVEKATKEYQNMQAANRSAN